MTIERDIAPTIPGCTLLEKSDAGGTAELWKAIDAAGNLVAVKVLFPELAADAAARKAFEDEAALMSEMNHPGIVKCYGHGVCDGRAYSILEFIDGYTFGRLLARKGHVSEANCLLIAESVASALACAWDERGIVHCDLKPENVMINTSGEVKIIDLGSVYRFGSTDGVQSSETELVGTPAYVSPEQVVGGCGLDCRSDIYSLGATLYHLATDQTLFPDADHAAVAAAHCLEDRKAPDPRDVVPDLSLGFACLFESMLVKDRNARLASWADVFDLCRAVEEGSDLAPRTTSAASSIRLRTDRAETPPRAPGAATAPARRKPKKRLLLPPRRVIRRWRFPNFSGIKIPIHL